MSRILIAVGANIAGAWGPPEDAVRRLRGELRRGGVHVLRTASWYRTEPFASARQPPFLNTVLAARTALSPVALLGLCKRLERRAGRVRGPRNGPRPLDLDILAYERRVVGWPPSARPRGRLIVPHPELHRRPFVLVPLAELAPRWRHPVLRASARQLLARLSRRPADVAPA